MLFLAIFLFVAALWSLAMLLGVVGTSDKAIKSRLRTGNRQLVAATAPPKRLVLATDVRLGVKRVVSPTFLIAKNERNLILAGRPPGWTIPRMLMAKAILTGIAVLLMIAVLASSSGPKVVLATAILVVIAYVLPDVLLQGKAQDRQKQIEIDLPDVLDQATIAIESGLSFEAALARVGLTAKGPLVEEIVRTVQDMRLGISRREAYAALSKRTSCQDLQRFTKSIVQAEEFGVPVANVVRSLAKEMRIKRRYRAEAKALQIPVKMLFPLLVCIFPVLFVVVLFPAFADLGATLAGNSPKSVMTISGPASRFDSLSRKLCWALVAGTLALIVLGLSERPAPVVDGSTMHVSDSRTDNALYRATVERMQNGGGYYRAASIEQAERGYPLRPVMTVREPALSYAAVAVGGVAHLRFVLIGLGIAATLCLLVTLEAMAIGRAEWWLSVIAAATALAAAFSPKMVVIHEVWAMLFIIISLTLTLHGRPKWSAAFGLLAVLVRELAFPFVAVMLVLAWREKRQRDVRAWMIVVGVFTAAYAAHVVLVLTMTSPGSVRSPGWAAFGGWAFVLETIRSSSALLAMPVAITAVVVPMALLGWLSRTGRFADRILLMLAIYLPLFTVVGQSWNSYWGLLYTALLLPGLGFVPSAATSLWKRLREPAPERICT